MMRPDENRSPELRIAVLIPCLNEAQTVGRVVKDFAVALPGSQIYVYDNGSSDATVEQALAAGAIVQLEPKRGKGTVLRRMLSDIQADIYVLVDGDATYDAASAPGMVQLLIDQGLDLVNGARQETEGDPYRPGHKLGNRILTSLVRWVFHSEFHDMLSGLKVCSRRFAKSFPAFSEGFEIETEMTIHALEQRMPVAEVEVPYRERPPGSASKLSTLGDGWIVLRTIGVLIKEEKPLQFFATLTVALAAISVWLVVPIFQEYVATGLVPRFPTAILASALMILAFLSLACGIILDTVTHGRKELKRLAYLSIAAPIPPG
jgi:glycosyltransferase involved in cell wall biosynthesis